MAKAKAQQKLKVDSGPWILYCWLIVASFVLGVIRIYGKVNLEDAKLGDLLEILLAAAAVFGVYCYVYKKRFFSPQIWLSLFFVLLIDKCLGIFSGGKVGLISLLFETTDIPRTYKYTLATQVLETIMSIPAYVALYRLGTEKTEKKKK